MILQVYRWHCNYIQLKKYPNKLYLHDFSNLYSELNFTIENETSNELHFVDLTATNLSEQL